MEIMAPVGSYESLQAAIQGGADAVYFGIGKLNMRSRSAANFNLTDLQQIAQICQEHHIHSYLTVNTIVYDNEIAEVHEIVKKALESGISAIIASDFAVITYARSIGMEVHISTQCNITNIEAVRFYAQFADVMVTARELNLQQVYDITTQIREQHICGPSGNLIQIEVFGHGALCMAVSGKCYISLDNFNQSANRGACLQACRRAYHVKDYDSEIELMVDNKYIMSPKDLCTIGFLDRIIQAGVRVLKIEGRGRSAEYVKKVTQCYKEAVKAIEQNRYTQESIDLWIKDLRSVYNRDFWDGYYLGRKVGEWTQKYGSQAQKIKLYIGQITNYFAQIGVVEIKIETHHLKVGDDIIISGPTTGIYEDTVQEIRVNLKSVKTAEKGVFCSIPVKTVIRRHDKVYKWIDNPNQFEI